MMRDEHRHGGKPSASVLRVLLLLVCLSGPELGRAQETGRLRFLTWSYRDAGALVQAVGTHAPLVVLGGAVLLVPTAPLDPPLLEEVQEGYRGPVASYLNVTNELGGPAMPPVAVGMFAVSLATDDATFQDAAFTSLQALGYASAITRVLKGTFGRYRPEARSGAYRFAPFSGNRSFPSGHTTAAFALITPWVLYYPNGATYGLFALSAGTAVARIALDKHWPTDVLGGAAIGFFTARYLTRRHQHSVYPETRPTVQPLITPAAVGFTVHIPVSFLSPQRTK